MLCAREMRGIYSNANAVTPALAQAAAYFGLSVGFISPVIPAPFLSPATNLALRPVIDITRSAVLAAAPLDAAIEAPAAL